MKEYFEDATKVIEQYQSRPSGLTEDEATERLNRYGCNRLKEGRKTTLIQRFLKEFSDPMILILIAAAVISVLTSLYANEPHTDAIIIIAVVLINAVLGVLQESKAEKAIEALQQITAATSKIVRGGVQRTLRSEVLVPGDIIVLEAGDAVPADCRVLESASMKAEEAALTGESVPVSKSAEALSAGGANDIILGDRTNMVYMGSAIVYGRGRAVVCATGMETEMGKIAGAISASKEESTPLQQKLNQLSKSLSVIVLGICVFIFAINVIKIYPAVTVENMLDTFMVAVSLAVAAIPEGLVAVVTIVLSIGVTKMARRSAVIRKLTAVETLGCTQIICSDKTGTLTQNRMTVVETSGGNDKLLALAMALASDAKLNENNRAEGEPTECALVNYAYALGLSTNMLDRSYVRIGEAPFDSVRKMMSVVCETPDGGVVQYTKGAPDEVLNLCDIALVNGKEVRLTQKLKEEFLSENKRMADKALRVLCAAKKDWKRPPETCAPATLEKNLCYIGLAGMIDPVRAEVKDAIALCKAAGIRPIMITGDHLDTARAIAKELDIIRQPSEAITGQMLGAMTDEELFDSIDAYSVYARVQPEHKVRIVEAWKKRGKITAMTGDGVNDAPSIKKADIGVGMGITGTDVTKNVADMVLADDNFATIIYAVEEGRRIYDNIRKAIQFLLASNLSEVLAVFTATLLGFTILMPVHLLWINLITDTFPALALGMETAESDVMRRPPREAKEGIFADGMFKKIVFQGSVVTLITLAAYFIGHRIESGLWEIAASGDGMTMAFLTLSMTEIFHSFNMRSLNGSIFAIKQQNKFLWLAMLASFVCTTAVIYIPALRAAFGFTQISLKEYAVAIALALSVIPVVEIEKAVGRRKDAFHK